MDSDFRVRVGQFEGPLDLLLELIEKRKLHISDVSLSQVADEFVEYIKSFDEQREEYVADLADFILVASTLLLIKSKSLLPNLELSEEERISIEDLERRLVQYKRYRELALGLEKMFGNFLYFAEERPDRYKKIIFSPSQDIGLAPLRSALADILKNLPVKFQSLPKVAVAKIISLEEMMEKLSLRIEKSLRGSFGELAGFKGSGSMSGADKVEIIVSFLAMLELVKRGAIRVSQNRNFEDIEIETEATGVPSYY